MVRILAAAAFGVGAALGMLILLEGLLESRLRARAGAPGPAKVPYAPRGWRAWLQNKYGLGEALPLAPVWTAAASGACLAVLLEAGNAVILVSALGAAFLALKAIEERRLELRREAASQVPTLLDLLSLSVRAGSSVDSSLQIAQPYLPAGLLSRELSRSLGEMRIGVPRADALRSLAERLPVPSLRSAISALRQAESLGSPVAGTLGAQAKAARAERLHALEAEAQKIPVKLLFPLLVFIFPVTLAVILGPVVLRLLSFAS